MSYFFVVPQKVFIKTFKAFIKPFVTPQRSVKIKIKVNFLFIRPGLGEKGYFAKKVIYYC